MKASSESGLCATVISRTFLSVSRLIEIVTLGCRFGRAALQVRAFKTLAETYFFSSLFSPREICDYKLRRKRSAAAAATVTFRSSATKNGYKPKNAARCQLGVRGARHER